MGKRRGRAGDGEGKASKTEKAVATHVRHVCPTKTTMVNADQVHYMIGSKAVDCLLASNWSATSGAKEPLFHNRSTATEYMQGLLNLGMLWRARKLVPKTKPDESKKGGKKGDAEKEEDTSKETKKKKRKVRLEFHADQVFIDGSDVYVWHFDPITWTKFMIGLLLLFGSIVMCLFPLWPQWMRVGVYYCSLGAMGLIALLFALVILRAVVFGMLWGVSGGRHHLWILPNLTADCGVLESFQPAYSYLDKANATTSAPRKSSVVQVEDDDKAVDEEANEGENEGEKVEETPTESSAPPSPESNARRRARKAE